MTRRLLGTRVVGNLEHRFLLNHGRALLLRSRHDFDDAPALRLRQRTRFHYAYGVTHSRIMLVVGTNPLRPRDSLAVKCMRKLAREFHDNRLMALSLTTTPVRVFRIARVLVSSLIAASSRGVS